MKLVGTHIAGRKKGILAVMSWSDGAEVEEGSQLESTEHTDSAAISIPGCFLVFILNSKKELGVDVIRWLNTARWWRHCVPGHTPFRFTSDYRYKNLEH